MGEELRERVKERYAVAARSVLTGLGRLRAAGRRGERGLDSEAAGGGLDKGRLFGRGAGRAAPGGGCGLLGVRQPYGSLPRCLVRWSWTWAAVAA